MKNPTNETTSLIEKRLRSQVEELKEENESLRDAMSDLMSLAFAKVIVGIFTTEVEAKAYQDRIYGLNTSETLSLGKHSISIDCRKNECEDNDTWSVYVLITKYCRREQQ